MARVTNKPTSWHHYEKWEASMAHKDNDAHTRIEDHGSKLGYYMRIGLNASARGAECYEQEIDTLIKALIEAKAKIVGIRHEKEQQSGTRTD